MTGLERIDPFVVGCRVAANHRLHDRIDSGLTAVIDWGRPLTSDRVEQ